MRRSGSNSMLLEKRRSGVFMQFWCCKKMVDVGFLYGTYLIYIYIFMHTYIYRKNQLHAGKNLPYMDPMGNSMSCWSLTSWNVFFSANCLANEANPFLRSPPQKANPRKRTAAHQKSAQIEAGNSSSMQRILFKVHLSFLGM